MSESVPPAGPSLSASAAPATPDSLLNVLESLAGRAVEASGGLAGVIRWSGRDGTRIVHAPTDPHWRAALDAVVALAARQFEYLPRTITTVPLESGQLNPLLAGRPRGDNAQGIAWRASGGAAETIIILLTPVGRPARELAALAQLVGESLEHIAAGEDVRSTRDFWVKAGAASRAQLAQIRTKLAATKAAEDQLDAALKRCMKLRPSQRFATLGAIFAELGPFDEWIVATSGRTGLLLEASSRGVGPLRPGSNARLAECIARNEVIVRSAQSSDGKVAAKPSARASSSFARSATCVCVPCGPAVIALATHREVASEEVGKLQYWARWLSPLVESWSHENETERLQKLVGDLGLRLFSAADRERQRIARDLHDHLSQLLAAARIALEADPERTREILRELDESLRQQLREIRPATLGRGTLRAALRSELDRLADAGIRGKLTCPTRPIKAGRVIEELCYQVAREAVSNIIRHSKATSADVSITRVEGRIVLRVTDNGMGLPVRQKRSSASRQASGVGLEGMRERLELMGGRLAVERVGKTTQVTAEIPDLQ